VSPDAPIHAEWESSLAKACGQRDWICAIGCQWIITKVTERRAGAAAVTDAALSAVAAPLREWKSRKAGSRPRWAVTKWMDWVP
jgi:hypothetical protein